MASKTAGIFKRGTTWYARFFIPADQQARLGKEDIAWSLKTGDIREARKRLPALHERFQALITPPDPHRLDLEARYGIPADLPTAEALRRLAELSQAAQQVDAAHWAQLRAEAGKVKPGSFRVVPKAGQMSPEKADQLRQEALFGHRADSPHFVAAATDAGMPADRIMAVEDAVAALVGAPAPGPIEAAPGSIFLTDLKLGWIRENQPAPKTVQEAETSISLLEALVGRLPATDFTREHGIRFKDHLLALPGRRDEVPAPGTVMKRINHIKVLLKRLGNAETSWTGITLKKRVRKRLPFTIADLDLIFSPANLPDRLTDRWLLLLGLYTGGRLNELAQLRCPDLRQEAGVWYISVDDLADDDDGTQRIKNDGSRRHVVLHPAVLESGFVEFVGSRQGLVFVDLEFDPAQGYSKEASKRLNRYIRSLIDDDRKVYHSLRHTFKTIARNSGVPEDCHDFITGHAGRHVGRDYGHGPGLQAAYAEISKIEGRSRLP